jgi:ParB-like chromosome segregation protein Spo0J
VRNSRAHPRPNVLAQREDVTTLEQPMDIAPDPEPRNPLHPLANIFPLMEGDAFGALVADIRANGLRDATLHEDKILDGRNRYRACRDAGVEPRFESPDIDDPLAFVIGKNALRRHLNESQRSMAAAKVANMRQGERTDLPSKGGKSLSQNDTAKLFNVGISSVQRAVLVVKHGSAELQQAVERGEISVSAAAEQVHAERAAKKSDEQQRQAGAAGPKLEQADATKIEPSTTGTAIHPTQPSSRTGNTDATLNAEDETAGDQEEPDVEPGPDPGDAEHGKADVAKLPASPDCSPLSPEDQLAFNAAMTALANSIELRTALVGASPIVLERFIVALRADIAPASSPMCESSR